MHKLRIGLGGVAMLAATPSHAQGTTEMGLPSSNSGQPADAAAQMDNGIKLHLTPKAAPVAGKQLEIIRPAVGGPPPDVAKRLSQELVVRDGVDILAGFVLTP